MDEVTNEKRAGWGAIAVEAFAQRSGSELETDEALRDLLSDLMHYSDAKGYDFTAALDLASGMHEAEIREDGGKATGVVRPVKTEAKG